MKIIKHECREMYTHNISAHIKAKIDITTSKEIGAWWLKFYDARCTIKYCPWCGKKLERVV